MVWWCPWTDKALDENGGEDEDDDDDEEAPAKYGDIIQHVTAMHMTLLTKVATDDDRRLRCLPFEVWVLVVVVVVVPLH